MKANFKMDPVCGMDVDPSHAGDETQLAGQTYYFCSRDCRELFDANPAQYLQGSLRPTASHRRTVSSPHLMRRGTSGTRQRGLSHAR